MHSVEGSMNTIVAYTNIGYAKATATKYAKAEMVEKGCKQNMNYSW